MDKIIPHDKNQKKRMSAQVLHLFPLENKVSLLNGFRAGFSVFFLNKNMKLSVKSLSIKKGTVSLLADFI